MYISELSFQKRDLLTLLVRICGDLSRNAGVEGIFQEVLQNHSSLDLIIHCAAHRHIDALTFKHGESLEDLETAIKSASWESWEHAFQLNVLLHISRLLALSSCLALQPRKVVGVVL
jgi:NAD(P)-dependent dehydrogenase (short-subunit alcohol dehydrogenase family)